MLHPGHLNILEKAKSYGKKLIVGIVDDKPIKELKGNDRPIQDVYTRMKIVSSIKFVDQVLIQKTYDPTDNLEIIRPAILVKGDDWDFIPGQDWIDKNGGKLIKPAYSNNFSTSGIVKKIKNCD